MEAWAVDSPSRRRICMGVSLMICLGMAGREVDRMDTFLRYIE